MDFILSLLSSMGPASRFVALTILLFVLLLILRTLWIVYQRGKTPNENEVKNVYVVSVDGNESLNGRPSSRDYAMSTAHTGKERRKYPRYKVQCQVEFIKYGHLFKEISKDLSYTGIFLKSKMPDKYSIGDKVLLTFQLPKVGPQKHNGYIVRKDETGIGIHFVP